MLIGANREKICKLATSSGPIQIRWKSLAQVADGGRHGVASSHFRALAEPVDRFTGPALRVELQAGLLLPLLAGQRGLGDDERMLRLRDGLARLVRRLEGRMPTTESARPDEGLAKPTLLPPGKLMLLLSAPRSGSTILAHALANTGRIHCE
jgi:hypothetical protein